MGMQSMVYNVKLPQCIALQHGEGNYHIQSGTKK